MQMPMRSKKLLRKRQSNIILIKGETRLSFKPSTKHIKSSATRKKSHNTTPLEVEIIVISEVEALDDLVVVKDDLTSAILIWGILWEESLAEDLAEADREHLQEAKISP